MFRVVYYGPSTANPLVDQLHDQKFETKDEAISFAKTLHREQVQYVQEFTEDGTPIVTYTSQEITIDTAESKPSKRNKTNK